MTRYTDPEAVIRKALEYYAEALGSPSGNLAREGLDALDQLVESKDEGQDVKRCPT